MKPLAQAKERLSEVLSPDQRRALSLAMLEDVVHAATALDAVWVLNSDADAADVARAAGGEARDDPTPGAGLNASLDAATADAIRAGFEGVLVLSADCPAATQADIRSVALGPGVMLAPDRALKGTNALWRCPPDAIFCEFGPKSMTAHMSLAHGRGVSFAVVPNPRLALDIDRPEDLAHAARLGVGPATRAVLTALGYASRH